jgi:UDP-2-acetamido-3-amino-2,3-dideoxy-glucuronate N-acetyltransferase
MDTSTSLRVATTKTDISKLNRDQPFKVLDDAVVIPLRTCLDLRGTLTVTEFDDKLPFTPKRVFLVYDVPGKHVRGEHAHRCCRQFLVCVSGSVSIVLDNGSNRREIVLDEPRCGLYIPTLLWATQYRFSEHTVMMVYASEPYDADDYIRDYNEFLSVVQGGD